MEKRVIYFKSDKGRDVVILNRCDYIREGDKIGINQAPVSPEKKISSLNGLNLILRFRIPLFDRRINAKLKQGMIVGPLIGKIMNNPAFDESLVIKKRKSERTKNTVRGMLRKQSF